MGRQVVDYRLPFRSDLALQYQLLQLGLDFSNHRAWRDTADAHDLFARDEGLESGRALDLDRLESRLQLVELLRLRIRRRRDVRACQRHQPRAERCGVPRAT